MFLATPRPGSWSTSCAWLVLALWFCVATSGCSPRNTAADGAGAADAVADTGFDVGGDLSDSVDVSTADVQDSPSAEIVDALETDLAGSGEVLDAITDVIAGDAPDSDVVQVDIPIYDATPAVDTAVPCSATEIPAPLTGTVEFQAEAYIYNPVVMGCGKGPPKSVKEGTAGCCNCAPPYSCYCNGECGWLRAPDLVKPQHDGQAVWTGKWVVSLGEAGQQYESPASMNLQRWQPGSGKGFELVPVPSPGFPIGNAVLLLFEKKVIVAVSCCQGGPTTYTPVDPIYLYDPDSNSFSKITMPLCGKLMVSGGTLVCVAAWQPGPPLEPGGLHVYNAAAGSWALVQPPGALVGKKWSVMLPSRCVADEEHVYFVGAIATVGAWPDGTPGWPYPGHLLKYSIKSKQWADIGLVPAEWQEGRRFMDHIGIVMIKGAIQAARFRLDSLKWEVGPKFLYSKVGHQEPILTPCGILFGSGTQNAMGGGTAYRPVLLAGDLSWKLLSPWGYPNDAVTSRNGGNFLTTDKEILALGGVDGPPEGNFVYHQDSYRYPLSALCNNGGSP